MSFRSRILDLFEIAIRVPPLFVIDEILKIGIGYETLEQHDLSNHHHHHHQTDENKLHNGTISHSYDPIVYRIVLVFTLRLLLSSIGCAVALCLFILESKHLLVVYTYLFSLSIVFISYWSNSNTIRAVCTLNDTTILTSILTPSSYHLFAPILAHLFQNYLLQSLAAFIFVRFHPGPRHKLVQRLLPYSFILPSTLALFPAPAAFLTNIPLFSALLAFALLTVHLWFSLLPIIQTITRGYHHARTFVANFGMSALVEREWMRLSVPEVLRTFWLLRTLANCALFFATGYWLQDDGLSPYYRLMKYLLVTGCDTLTAVLGITSIVSYVSTYIGKFFQWLLLSDDDSDKNFGTVSAIVFYILALQTGLTGLEPEIRFVRLCRNFCLLFTAILHFVHNVLNPLLMSLSASHNPSLRRHLHALLVCFVLVLLPVLLMYYLWTTQETSTWLLAVSSFSIEVIVKVFVSLAIYSLFLLDARRETFWEKLDDYIYYIRAFGNTVEFCFGIFLFFNGAWILLFESGSAIRAVMMCIHAYFNIWCDAKSGWSVFMKRRTAVNKIESLPEADEQQLRDLDDVCAICYQEMRSAKITKCKHYFHGVCLRKWLYVQDRCPLCHEILHGIECEERKGVGEGVGAAAAGVEMEEAAVAPPVAENEDR